MMIPDIKIGIVHDLAIKLNLIIPIPEVGSLWQCFREDLNLFWYIRILKILETVIIGDYISRDTISEVSITKYNWCNTKIVKRKKIDSLLSNEELYNSLSI